MDWRAARIVVVCLASLAGAGELGAAKGDPVVRLIEPERGERRFVAPASIPLEAQANAAPQRSIVRVEFFFGETLIGETSAAPHAITWSNVPEGEYRLRVRATDNTGAIDWSPFIRVHVRPNREPRVRLTEPAQDARFNAPESIVLSAIARDRDHNLARVEFYADGILFGTATAEPYRVSWGPVPGGDHVLIAKAIDALGATDESRPIRIHVTGAAAGAKLYFIHVDHLNTPRLIADEQQRTVWKWDQQEPFGATAPDENPSGLGRFEFPLRLPGQYFDEETNLHYNYFRDYDPSLGRYLQSDPIGLEGGMNTYAYVHGDPLRLSDPEGLEVRLICRDLRAAFPFNSFQHCFVHITCPQERWASTLSLYGGNGRWPKMGYRAANEGPDDPRAAGQFNQAVTPPNQCFGDPCAYEKAVLRRFNLFQSGLVPYSPMGPNSNSFAAGLITGNQYGGALPAGAPGPIVAPGINMSHPGFTK